VVDVSDSSHRRSGNNQPVGQRHAVPSHHRKRFRTDRTEPTGPNLTPPAPGTFAELDAPPVDDELSGAEPTGVSCANGGSRICSRRAYTVTEVTPEGYATTAPRNLHFGSSGSTTVVDVSDTAIVGNYTTGSGLRMYASVSFPHRRCPVGDRVVRICLVRALQPWIPRRRRRRRGQDPAVFSGGPSSWSRRVSLVGSAASRPRSTSSGTVSDPFSWFTYPLRVGVVFVALSEWILDRDGFSGVYRQSVWSGSGRTHPVSGVYIVTDR